MRERFIISPWLFNVYMDAAMKTKMGIGRMDRVPNERIRELCGETREVDHQLEQPEIRFEFVYMCG